MKFIIEQSSYKLTDKENKDIYNKMYAIQENLETIEDYSDTGNCPCNEDNVESITVDLFSAVDEFMIEGNFKSGSEHYAESPYIENDNFLSVEVVTEKVAISNDKDFLDSSEKKEYKLGGDLSSYKPLGESGYWYRLL